MDQEPGKRTNEEGQLDLGCKIIMNSELWGFNLNLKP